MISNISTLRDSELYTHQQDKCRKAKDLSKTFAQKQDYQQENNTTDSKHNELIESPSPRKLRNPTRLLKMQAKYQLFHKMGKRFQVTAVHFIFHVYLQATAFPTLRHAPERFCAE